MMVVLYKPGAGFSLAHPAKEKDEASLIDCAHYFARWLGRPHLVYMDGEKAGVGASFQSWLRGDGSPGLHPIKYRQGPPYNGGGHPFHLDFSKSASWMESGGHRGGIHALPGNRVARSHCTVLGSAHARCCHGFSQAQGEKRSRGTFYCPAGSPGTSVDGPGQPPPLGGVLDNPVSIRKEPSSWLRRVENRRILDYGKLLQGRRGEQVPATADGQGEATSVTGDSP
uniref:Uncharacterized protein n=1 Tax=Chromera velia CCMP2878 TaxID=1169474 RepID=A0A0G4I2Q1_9ALVE|eukprot:Cvel_10431.t1-p1 / transcript=Cvel_10431.t1 / gene=Cvel_10431 / organism=Chromera_velia_CCMP2878 / gene_product=hypothetical protein / transcript_product=hypothetical protein / location=Cvel_scaffold628:58542-59374(-) / protein_length=225 / sequence_SO=supercontig / SO=protein_coding / is_pseudo=false